jgi:hypothetical protein
MSTSAPADTRSLQAGGHQHAPITPIAMPLNWIPEARTTLLRMHHGGGGWGYGPSGMSYTEPTALGSLAVLANGPTGEIPDKVRESADWLASIQQPDGALGVSGDIPRPAWPTAIVTILWACDSAWRAAQQRAVQWLLARQGHTFPQPRDGVVGHDTQIPGWPWVEGTHPWVEPTAWSMLAICRAGQTGNDRVTDGARLIINRSIAGGGWNVGNSSVFGKPLLAHPGPTGLALLALAAAGSSRTSVVGRGLDYLRRALPATTAPQSLCWGILALTAWGERPPQCERWLESSYAQIGQRTRCATQFSYLLLAAGQQSLTLLGANRPTYTADHS